jgi:hypothetical protein
MQLIGGICLLVGIALVGWSYQGLQRKWEREAKEEQARIEVENLRRSQESQTQKIIHEIVNKRQSYKLWKEKGDLKDAWSHAISVEEVEGDFPSVTATSAGFDGVFDTVDDIKDTKGEKITAQKVGVAVGKTVAEFGIGSVKGVYQSVKNNLTGEK